MGENKGDLISREALLGKAQTIYRDAGNGTIMTHKVVLSSDIVMAPTVDAQPVVHGRWENNGYDDEWTCSCCREGQVLNDFTPEEVGLHYCPNCGAKMDGGDPHV